MGTGKDSVDWAAWRELGEVELWQAIALSLNIEPRAREALQAEPEAMRRWKVAVSRRGELELRRARRAAGVAGRSNWITDWAPGGAMRATPRPAPSSRPATYMVQLPTFVAWAQKLDWSMPGELVKIVGPPELGTRERETLLLMVAALMKGHKLDWQKPSKAATAISALADDLGVKVGQRTIEEHLKHIPDLLQKRGP